MGFLPGIESTDGSLPAYERVFAASDSMDVAEMTGRDDAVASFAAQVAVDAPNLDEGDVAGLRWHGLSEEDRLPSRLVDELTSGRPAG